MEWPDEGWHDQRVRGKELELWESNPIMHKLDRALQMNPGRLPHDEHEKWKSMIDPAEKPKPTPSFDAMKNSTLQAVSKTQSSSARASAPASPTWTSATSGARPDRQGKKRRYHEGTYEGYNDAYNDEDGYSTGGVDDSRGSATKKRRKV